MKFLFAFMIMASLLIDTECIAQSNTSSKPSNNSSKPPATSSSKPPSTNSSKPPTNNSVKPPAANNNPKPPERKQENPPAANNSKPPVENKPQNNNSSKPPSNKPKQENKPKEGFDNPDKPPVVNNSKKPPSNNSSKPPTTADKTNPQNKVEPSNPKIATKGGDTDNSKKITTDVTTQSAKAEAAKQERSRRLYVESEKAKAPPKTEYKTPDGKTVNVKPDSVATKTIREKPSSYYQPEVRQQRTETHVHHYHYQHPSTWYYSQPSVYVGGGYSSAFWWMMMEWDANRRAEWLYNHRNSIERDAYERGIRDAAVANRIAELQAQNARVNPDYVDPEFAKDPSVMYTQEHVEAIYNPEISNGNSGLIILTLGGMLVLCVAAYVLVFVVRWGK